MRRSGVTYLWMMFFLLLFIVGCAALKLPGCSGMKPRVCALIEKGIKLCDGHVGNPDDVLTGEIMPAFKAKGLSDIMDKVKGYWDGLSTEQKLAFAKDLLAWLDTNWCGTASGIQAGYRMSVREGVLAIMRGEQPR